MLPQKPKIRIGITLVNIIFPFFTVVSPKDCLSILASLNVSKYQPTLQFLFAECVTLLKSAFQILSLLQSTTRSSRHHLQSHYHLHPQSPNKSGAWPYKCLGVDTREGCIVNGTRYIYDRRRSMSGRCARGGLRWRSASVQQKAVIPGVSRGTMASPHIIPTRAAHRPLTKDALAISQHFPMLLVIIRQPVYWVQGRRPQLSTRVRHSIRYLWVSDSLLVTSSANNRP